MRNCKTCHDWSRFRVAAWESAKKTDRNYDSRLNIITINDEMHTGYESVGQLLNIILRTLRRARAKCISEHNLVESWISAKVSKDIY